MPPTVRELEISDRTAEKLGRRAISAAEVHQIPGNDLELRKNPRAPRGSKRPYLFGETDGGRRLTLVVEPTHDPAVWLVVTGWQTKRRRVRWSM